MPAGWVTLAVVRRLNRREFGAAACGAIALGARRRTSAALPLRIGIGSYTYHRLSIDEMIVQLRRLDVREIELSHGAYMLFSQPAPALFAEARSKLARAGIACVSYYTATIASDTDLDKAVRFAHVLGVPHVTGDATGAMLAKIDGRFTREGLTFGIHNHYFKDGFAYESADDVLRALAGVSATIGASLDVGHIASCGHDTVDAVRRLAPRLQLVHLKDVRAAGGEDNVLLGTGVARIPEVMRELRAIDFAGLVAIEYEKEGPVEADAANELAYARARR